MARRPILEEPDPRLRVLSDPVAMFDEDLARLCQDLLDTLYGTSGIGLSAPQIGEPLQVLVMDHSEARDTPEIYINPQMRFVGQRCLVEESCLSLPGVEGLVPRMDRVQVRAFDLQGQRFERELEGMPAVCLQHEMDHLAGRLFVDRVSLLHRWYMRGTAALRAVYQRRAA